jgi:adenosylcobinamide-phosphate synthase
MTAVELLAACLLDAVMGDPRWLPHPVRGMGRIISWYEGIMRTMASSPVAEGIAGLLLVAALPAAAYGLGWVVIEMAARVHPWARTVAVIVLSFTALAGRDLVDHALAVLRGLNVGSLDVARTAVSHIVGRDTEKLSEPEVVRATVETIAESTADGIVAPLFYLTLGGPALALAFKSVSTLDSMIGHLEAPYRHFGWASARLDDVLNWIPARLTGLLFVLAAGLTTGRMAQAWRILRRDGAKHPSPNSGRPEAAMAGALGVELGGINWYAGELCERPRLGGDQEVQPAPGHIQAALTLMIVTSVMAVALAAFAIGVTR